MASAPSAQRRLRVAALIVILAICAACASTPSPTPATPTQPTWTATLPLSTHAGPLLRATLPATWTETPTATDTLTPTATPVTPTATATQVPQLADLCPSLTVSAQFANGSTFHWNKTIVMTLGTPLTAVLDPVSGKTDNLTVRFLAVNLLTRQNLGVQLNGGLVAFMELPIHELPGPGFYSWKVAVYGDSIGERCTQGGFFVVSRTADDLMTATALASITPSPTAVITEEATEDGTIIPIFQGAIPGVGQ